MAEVIVTITDKEGYVIDTFSVYQDGAETENHLADDLKDYIEHKFQVTND